MTVPVVDELCHDSLVLLYINCRWFAQQAEHNMIRIFVTLVVVAALGHVNSRPQNFPFSPSSLLGTNNNKNGTSNVFGYIPPNLLNPSALSGVFPVLGGQRQTTAPSADRKKRNPGSFPFQNLIPSFIPSMFIPTGTEQDSTTTEKPSANWNTSSEDI